MANYSMPEQGETQTALKLIRHRRNPCVPGTGCASRVYYDRLIRDFLKSVRSPCAKGLLEIEIQN
jgi:hypothetical protein